MKVLINNNIQKNIQIINKSTLLNYSIQNHDMEQKYKKICTFYFFLCKPLRNLGYRYAINVGPNIDSGSHKHA